MDDESNEISPEEPAPEPAPEPASAPPAPASDAPWSADLASSFEDEAIRAQVDQFLRNTVQPHITQLEQNSIENRDANRLWNDFAENPTGTWAAVSRELFGDDISDRLIAAINDDDFEEVERIADEVEETSYEDLDPRLAKLLEREEDREREEAYNSELARIKSDHDLESLNEELFYPFVVASNGDFDVAAQAYKDYAAKAQAEFGIQVPSPDDIVPPSSPPVIGGSQQHTAPPQQKEYKDLDDAMDAFFNEQRQAPQVVGA